MIFYILIGIFSCQRDKNPVAITPVLSLENNAWAVYEGRVPLHDKTDLYIELAMLPGVETGEGSYRIEEFIEEDFTFIPASTFKGKYSTLYGDEPGEMILQFHNSAWQGGLKRSYLAPGIQGNLTNSSIKMIREEPFRRTDLVLKVQGINKLLVLDDNTKPVTADPSYNLIRRTSKLFTLEGYFRHIGDTADFFEMNTREKWAVSKLGAYHQAILQYHKLIKEKSEVTYLKAVGFSIRHTNKESREIEALVIKRVLQMTSSPSLTEEYNHIIHQP